MFPEELIKKNINLYDNTYANDLITEENLKIKLSEKKYIRDELISNKQEIKEKVEQLEETQNELIRREKKYGKNLNLKRNVKLKNLGNNKTNIRTKYINTISNFEKTQRNKSNKRMKTVENNRNIIL